MHKIRRKLSHLTTKLLLQQTGRRTVNRRCKYLVKIRRSAC